MIPDLQRNPQRSPGGAGRHSRPSSAALAMLTLLPVHAPIVPRVHVEPRHPNGSLRVLDRITGEQLLVYTPRFTAQFRTGHRAGRWYVRPGNHVGIDLRSPGFATARAAIEAVTDGRWSRAAGLGDHPGPAPRVIWPDPGDGPRHGVRPRLRPRSFTTVESP